MIIQMFNHAVRLLIRLSLQSMIVTRIITLSSLPVYAYQNINHDLSITEYYSDNAVLAPRAFRQSEWITEIQPGIMLSGEKEHLDYSIYYQLQGIYYKHQTQPDKIFHRGFVHIDQSMHQDKINFFVDASLTQQVLFPQEQPFNTLRSSSQTTNVGVFQLGPQWQQAFGSKTQHRVALRYGETHYFSQQASHGEDWLVDGTLQDRQFSSKLTSAIQYQYRKTKQSDQLDFSTLRLNGYLQYQLHPRLAALFQIGYEDHHNQPALQSIEGLMWFAGFRYILSRRTQITVQKGERSFGGSTIITADWRNKRHGLSAGYHEDITTSTRQQIDSVQRAGIGNLLTNTNQFNPTFINQMMVTKNLQAEYRYQLPRSHIQLRIYESKNQILNQMFEEQGKGIQIMLMQQLRRDLQWLIESGISRHRFFNLQTDKRLTIGSSIDWQTGHRLSIRCQYQYFINQSPAYLRHTHENIAFMGFVWRPTNSLSI